MLLEVDEVHAGYGEMMILHGASIGVAEGEIVSLIGPNGAGKSTLLCTIFGLVKPQKGRLVFRKENIKDCQPQDLVHKGISFVPQSNNVFPSLTVQENLEMGAYISSENMNERFTLIYDLFPPLKEKRNKQAGTLSGGQQQMVAFGRALALEPLLLLLDEPTAGLSPQYVDLILAMIKDINKTGVSILMVEQNARDALEISDRGYVLSMGLTRYNGTGHALLNNKEVAQLFLGG